MHKIAQVHVPIIRIGAPITAVLVHLRSLFLQCIFSPSKGVGTFRAGLPKTVLNRHV